MSQEMELGCVALMPWNITKLVHYYQKQSGQNIFNTFDDEETEDIDYNSIWFQKHPEIFIKLLKNSEIKRAKFDYDITVESRENDFRRRNLITMCNFTANILKLNRTTFHLAVFLFDIYMGFNTITDSKLSLYILSCLIIAAKLEEKSSNIPKINILLGFSDQNTSEEFKLTEMELGTFFEWNLFYPTPITFLEYYLTKMLSIDDINMLLRDSEEQYKNENDIVKKAITIAFGIVDLTLENRILVQTLPSIIAAASISVTRTQLGLDKWNNHLIDITEYEYYQIDYTVDLILTLKYDLDYDDSYDFVIEDDIHIDDDNEDDGDESSSDYYEEEESLDETTDSGIFGISDYDELSDEI